MCPGRELSLIWFYLCFSDNTKTPGPSTDSEGKDIFLSVTEDLQRELHASEERTEALFQATKCPSDRDLLNAVIHADIWMIRAWTLMAIHIFIMEV